MFVCSAEAAGLTSWCLLCRGERGSELWPNLTRPSERLCPRCSGSHGILESCRCWSKQTVSHERRANSLWLEFFFLISTDWPIQPQSMCPAYKNDFCEGSKTQHIIPAFTHQFSISPLCPDSILSLMTTSLVTSTGRQCHIKIGMHDRQKHHIVISLRGDIGFAFSHVTDHLFLFYFLLRSCKIESANFLYVGPCTKQKHVSLHLESVTTKHFCC